jgi:hypothetical protein
VAFEERKDRQQKAGWHDYNQTQASWWERGPGDERTARIPRVLYVNRKYLACCMTIVNT